VTNYDYYVEPDAGDVVWRYPKGNDEGDAGSEHLGWGVAATSRLEFVWDDIPPLAIEDVPEWALS
jgi:hypothetical protein